MSVTQVVRASQLKAGTAYRILANDSAGAMSENAVLTAAYALISDANGQLAISSVTAATLAFLDVGSSVSTLLGGKLSLTGGTMSGAIAMGTAKITGLGAPDNDTDAATKLYVDSVAQGLNVHAPCHVATTGQLLTNSAGTQASHTLTFTSGAHVSIDGHPLVAADRVLVKNQTAVNGNPSYGNVDNGIYTVTNPGVTLTAATGTVTVVDHTAIALATVTVNGVVLTEGTQWNAGASNNAAAASLASAITTATATTLCTAVAVATNVVTITANTPGSAGNALTLATSDVVNLLKSGATLLGGLDAAACVLTRSLDFNGVPAGEVATGDFSFVQLGTANGGTGWVVTSGAGAIVVDTDPIIWSQFSGGGSFTAGNGIDVTGTVISLAPLLEGKIIVGNASNVATNVAMSGEATIIASGAVTLANSAVIAKVLTTYSSTTGTIAATDTIVGAISILNGNDSLRVLKAGDTMTGALTINPVSNQLVLGGVSSGFYTTISSTAPAANRVLTIPAATGNRNFLLSSEAAIVSADISASAGITLTQLAATTPGYMVVGTAGTGVLTGVAMSADATLASTGALTIANSAVTFGKTYQVVRGALTPAADNTTRVFTTASNFVSGSEMVFLNGILQNAGGGNDYTVTAANEITFELLNAPKTGSTLLISYWRA